MNDEEIRKLALEIRNSLIPPRCVSTQIAKEIQQQLREETYGRPWKYMQIFPMGSGGIRIELEVLTGGELQLVLMTMNGDPFWRVTLSSEETR